MDSMGLSYWLSNAFVSFSKLWNINYLYMTWISHRRIRLPCRCFYTKQMFVVYFLLQFFIAITKLSYGVILSYSKYTTTQPLFLPLNDNLIVLAARLTLNIFDRPILVWQKNYYSNDFLRKKRKYSKRHFFMYVSWKSLMQKKWHWCHGKSRFECLFYCLTSEQVLFERQFGLKKWL